MQILAIIITLCCSHFLVRFRVFSPDWHAAISNIHLERLEKMYLTYWTQGNDRIVRVVDKACSHHYWPGCRVIESVEELETLAGTKPERITSSTSWRRDVW